MRMRICGVVVLLLILDFCFSLSAWAALNITSPANATLASRTVSTSGQTTTGTIAGVEVSDDGAAGWEASMTSTHFTTIGAAYTIAGANNTVGTSGTYDGTYGVLDPVGRYEIEITTGGSVGTAIFKWVNPADVTTESVTTASEVVLEKGINATFAAATYQVGDKWQFGVDVFPYTGLHVTPSNITAVSGDTGVSKETSGYLTGAGPTSDALTVVTGATGNSTGTYQQDEGLELTIHANSLSGTYSATVTFTVL